MFTEALGWQHGVHFLCVAFQNRVAYAMGGSTLHNAGDISVGLDASRRKLDHADIDLLFTRNQALRWIITDEVFMIPDELRGAFNHKIQDAARETRYKRRKDQSVRIFLGVQHS